MARLKLKETSFYLLIYTLMFLVASGLGFHLEVPYHYFQYLDKIHLQNRFWESVFYLHSQPPALNTLLSMALWLQRAVAVPVEWTLLLLHFGLGAAIVYALFTVSHAIVKNRWAVHILMLLLLINPVFYAYLFQFFYTVYEMFFLSILFLFAHRFLSQNQVKDFVVICLILVALIYTRSLFHFVWAMMVIGLLLAMVMAERPLRHHLSFYRKLLLTSTITVILLLAWPLKNYLLFDFFGYSSWQGYNLSQGLPIEIPSIPDVFTSEKKFEEVIPLPYQRIPVLKEDRKSDGSPNWNYYPVINISKKLNNQAISIIKNQPGLVLQKMYRNYINGYSLPSGRNPYEGRIDLRVANSPVRFYWAKAYEILVFQYIGNDTRQNPLNGFLFLVPIVLVLAAWKFFQTWHTDPRSAKTMALIWFSFVWVLFMVLFVDGIEGNRMRFPAEPFFWVMVAWLLPSSKLNRSDLILSEH